MKYCKNCGMQLDTETQVCPKCGTGLTDDISDNKFKKEKKRHKRRYCILVILLIVVIAAAISITLLLSRNENRGTNELLLDNMDRFEQLELNDTDNPVVQAFRNKISYLITDIDLESDPGTATVIVYTPDLAQIIQQGINGALENSDGKGYQDLLETARKNMQQIINSENCPIQEQQIEMEARQDGDSFILVSNDQFEQAITGNPEKLYFDILMEEIQNDTEE